MAARQSAYLPKSARPMQLTRFTDYSLRVLIFLADRQGAPTTIKAVADAHRISENHLTKVVHRLAQTGYIRAVRGKGGGISLARAPAEISIGKVVRDVEPLAPAECFDPKYDGRCSLYPSCRLRAVLGAAQAHFLEALDVCALSDVLHAKHSDIHRAKMFPGRRQGRRGD